MGITTLKNQILISKREIEGAKKDLIDGFISLNTVQLFGYPPSIDTKGNIQEGQGADLGSLSAVIFR